MDHNVRASHPFRTILFSFTSFYSQHFLASLLKVYSSEQFGHLNLCTVVNVFGQHLIAFSGVVCSIVQLLHLYSVTSSIMLTLNNFILFKLN